MKKLFKQNKGITLVALVITIIVLLILSTISISLIIGDNSIINKAIDARNKTNSAKYKEMLALEVAGSYNSNGTIDLNSLS